MNKFRMMLVLFVLAMLFSVANVSPTTAAPSAQATAVTIIFQEGAEITVDGVGTGVTYAGTHDTFLATGYHGNPNQANGNAQGIYLDDWPCCLDALIRFENIFGPGVGQIPVGTTITSASLGLDIFDACTGINFGEIHTDQLWDEASASWNSVLGGNGVTFGTDTTFLGVGIPQYTGGWNFTDVTASLSAWSPDPSLNNGWGWKPDGGNTGLMAFHSSESASIGTRPSLSVTFYPVDTTPPDTSITAQPANLTNSTSVSFEFTGTDDVSASANLTFECRLDSGAFDTCTSPQGYSSLTDGSHTFEVQATDEASNTDPTPASYIWVVDTTPPVVTVPPDQEVVATGPVTVNYPPATATDADPPNPTVSCTPPSGSTFQVGVTPVTCSATDAAGNIGQASFNVTVLTPEQAAEATIEQVQDLVDAGVLNGGQGNAVISKLQNAIKSIDKGNTAAAINQLQAFINQVNGLINGGTLTPAEGQPLIDAANTIIASLGG